MRRLQAKPATGFGGGIQGEHPEKGISGEIPEEGLQGGGPD